MDAINQQSFNSIRSIEADRILNVLRKEANETLNINGKWGCGKTFVSRLVQSRLGSGDVIALRVNISDYYYVNDPLILFIITILDYINDEKNSIDLETKSQLLKSMSNVISIISMISLLFDPTGITSKLLETGRDLLSKEKPNIHANSQLELSLENIRSYQEAINKLGSSIELICTSLHKKSKIVIFIDDFDRVSPEFAFRILNIIHQLKAKISKLQICTIMNRNQFEHQLCHLYGNNNNDEHYLTKYIDLEISISNPILTSNPSMFYKEFKIEKKLESGLIMGWLSLLSVREVQIFNSSYQKVLKEYLHGNNSTVTKALKTDNAVEHYIILLYIILVKFDLDFKSFNAGLMNKQDCDTLISKLGSFSLVIKNKKNYQNYSLSTEGLDAISDIVFSLLMQKLNNSYIASFNGSTMEQFNAIQVITDDIYEDYFR